MHNATDNAADVIVETVLTLAPVGRVGKGVAAFASEFSTQLALSDGDVGEAFGNVNFLDVGVQTFVPGKKFGSNLLKDAVGNKFSYTLNQGFETSSNSVALKKTAIDATFGLKSSALNNAGLKDAPSYFKTFSEGLTNFNKGLAKDKVDSE